MAPQDWQEWTVQEKPRKIKVSLTSKLYQGGFAQDAVHCAAGHLSKEHVDAYKKYFADLEWADRVDAGANTRMVVTYTVFWESLNFPHRVGSWLLPSQLPFIWVSG